MRLCSLLVALSLPAAAAAVPLQLTHQGRVADNAGTPLEGAHQLHFALYASATDNAPLWAETLNTNLENGVFSLVLGGPSAPLDSALFDGSVRWLGLAVDDAPELPERIALVSVPYAVRAFSAERAALADALATPLSFADLADVPTDADSLAELMCVDGDVPTWQGESWLCSSPTPAAVDVSTLNGTIAITNLPVGGGATDVAAGDHAHAFSDITGELGLNRTNGNLPIDRLEGDLPLSRTTGDLPMARVSGDLPIDRTTGDLAIARTTGDLPIARISGDLPLTRTTGDLPIARVSGDLPIDRTTGNLAFSRLPVGTNSTTVARGDHTHDAAAIVSGTLDAARLPPSIKLGDTTLACATATRGQLKFTGTAVMVCGPSGWAEVWAHRTQTGASAADAGQSCKAIRDAHGGSDGQYWIDPDGSGPLSPIRTWCDMANGGWTLVGNVTNRWARATAPAAFFTSSIRQSSTGWSEDTSNNNPLAPTTYGVLKVDNWPKPAAIRYQNVEVSSGTVKDQITFTTTGAVDYLVASFSTPRENRAAGGAQGFSTAHNAVRTYHYASDHEWIWNYWTVFGRARWTAGWQFGLTVNRADNVQAYNGVNDDQGRSEFNLGVAGNPIDTHDITGYWAGGCTSGCNEGWSTSLGANHARTMVWYQ